MRTSSNFPFRVFTTRTMEPKGRLGCAAVRASESKRSPLAVLRPWNPGPYQLALPTQDFTGFIGWFRCATRGASITGAMRNIRSTQRSAAQIMKSRCLIRSEEHTSELQSQSNLVCRLLLEKKKNLRERELSYTLLDFNPSLTSVFLSYSACFRRLFAAPALQLLHLYSIESPRIPAFSSDAS